MDNPPFRSDQIQTMAGPSSTKFGQFWSPAIGLACWSLVLVLVGAIALERFWINPLRTQMKGVQIAAYGNAQRINSLENTLASAPIALLRGSTSAMTGIERCVDKQVAKVKANYDAVRSAFSTCSEPIVTFLNRSRLSFSEAETFAIFVTLITSRLGSYGPSWSLDPEQIARDEVLNCTQTMIFVAQTIKKYYPQVSIREIGISNQALGGHGFVEMTSDGRSILLDGLVGLVVDLSLDEATTGSRPRPFLMLDFFSETNPNLRAFADSFMRTLRLGGLTRADIVSDRFVLTASVRN